MKGARPGVGRRGTAAGPWAGWLAGAAWLAGGICAGVFAWVALLDEAAGWLVVCVGLALGCGVGFLRGLVVDDGRRVELVRRRGDGARADEGWLVGGRFVFAKAMDGEMRRRAREAGDGNDGGSREG